MSRQRSKVYGETLNPIIGFDEQSTRNCVHGKVTHRNGQLMVMCQKHPIIMTYQRVMKYRTFRPECKDCRYFEHDEEVKQ